MSYALRNTIILIVVLVALLGSGWGYIHFVQEKKITQMENNLRQKKQKLQNDKGIANQYDEVVTKYAKKRIQLKKFSKTIPTSLTVSSLYAYLNRVRPASSDLMINFTSLKSQKEKKKDYGIVRANLSGQGRYLDLYRLIKNIETSSPIVKVKKLVINSIGKKKSYNYVNFTFELDGYYSPSQKGNAIPSKIIHAHSKIGLNPFYPLIRGVKPNTNGLPEVGKSKLVGIGKDVAYIVDQDGKVKILHVGDKVYLGSLVSTSIKNKTATFELDKGGILSKEVLNLNQKPLKTNQY